VSENDTTTTTEQEPVQAQDVAQPDEPETQAVQDEDNSSDDNTNQTSDTDDSAEILEWAERKGLKVNEDTKPLLKMVRESEQKMHTATKEANALRNSVQEINEANDVSPDQAVLNRLVVTEFYLNNPGARELDDEMADIINEKPYLARDLDAVYEIAQSRASAKYTQEAVETSRKERLAQAAKADKAAPPQASATTRQSPQGVTDEDIANMTTAEYNAWRAENNPFLAP